MKMKVTLVCLALVALAAAAYAVPLPQDPSGYDPSLEELLEDKRGFKWQKLIPPLIGTGNEILNGIFGHFNRPQNAQAKRKFNWNDIPDPLLGLAGLFGRDLYEDAYAMNQREENEEDVIDEDSISEELLLDALEQELQNREEEKRDLAERQVPYQPARYMRFGKK